MQNAFISLNILFHQDPVFWFCALSGSLLFAVQFFLNFLIGLDAADDDGGQGDSGKFKWMSKQAVTGFLMMFGWVGLTCKKEFHLSMPSTVFFALLGGIFAIFATALLFKGARKLRSTGTVFRIEDAIGKEAAVYQRIPKEGVGKISLSLYGMTYEVDARSQNEEIPSFTQVQILKKSDEKTVIVVPLR